MLCPIDGTELKIADRSGVEIDYCPKCRGVWLDRGELDKIIERSATQMAPPETRAPAREAYVEDDGFGHPRGGKRKKRGGFLEDLFDF
jgi:Zn-finger nucleic acid-binding protein